MNNIYKGSCNCGGVRYEVRGKLGNIIACHCGQCRKQTGLHYATIQVAFEKFKFVCQDTLVWYRSSDIASRGFCHKCGSSLFWQPESKSHISILAGSFDDDIPSTFGKHIYCNNKAGFYELNDNVPKYDDVGNVIDG